MKTEVIFFSATGTTKKIAKAISQELNGEVHLTDITLPANRTSYQPVDSDLVMIATPIYGERIPRFICDFLQQIEGNGKPLVAISVYGNIGFGISLAQFEEYAIEHHFRLIAAGAFIGEHTYARKKVPVAYGRPDKQDLEQASAFGGEIREKLDAGNFVPLSIPRATLPKFMSNFPDSGTRFLIRQPVVDRLHCNGCGACSKRCPAGALDLDTLCIDEKKCIRCYACVKVCPKSARTAKFKLHLFETFFKHMGRKPKVNQTFL